MQRLGQHAPAGLGCDAVIAAGQAAQLVALEDLEGGHVVEGASGAGSDRAGAKHMQVERLLMVGVIAGGDIAADQQRQVVLAQVELQVTQIDIGLAQDTLLGRGQRRIGRWRTGASADLDRVELPQGAGKTTGYRGPNSSKSW